MSEWVPFQAFVPVYSKSYFVTLKNQPDRVECVNGRDLVGANNVLAVKEVEMPDPYVPPKPKRRERWVFDGEPRRAGRSYLIPQTEDKNQSDVLLDGQIHMREVLPGDPSPEVIADIIHKLRYYVACHSDIPASCLILAQADRLEGKP